MAMNRPIITRTGSGRPAAAASPPALALGCSSMTTGIMAREVMAAAISTAMTWRGSHIGARAIRRASSEVIRASAPKLPMRLSAMIASALSRSVPAPRPSAVSASPSSCRAPVSTTMVTIAISAEGRGGSPTSEAPPKASPASSPTTAPTSGKA